MKTSALSINMEIVSIIGCIKKSDLRVSFIVLSWSPYSIKRKGRFHAGRKPMVFLRQKQCAIQISDACQHVIPYRSYAAHPEPRHRWQTDGQRELLCPLFLLTLSWTGLPIRRRKCGKLKKNNHLSPQLEYLPETINSSTPPSDGILYILASFVMHISSLSHRW